MSRPQGPKPPQVPLPQGWRQGDHDVPARVDQAAAQGWAQPQAAAAPPRATHPQAHPHQHTQPRAQPQYQQQQQPYPPQQYQPPHVQPDTTGWPQPGRQTAPPQQPPGYSQPPQQPAGQSDPLAALSAYFPQPGQPASQAGGQHAPQPLPAAPPAQPRHTAPPRTAPDGHQRQPSHQQPQHPLPHQQPSFHQPAAYRPDPSGYDLGGYAAPPAAPVQLGTPAPAAEPRFQQLPPQPQQPQHFQAEPTSQWQRDGLVYQAPPQPARTAAPQPQLAPQPTAAPAFADDYNSYAPTFGQPQPANLPVEQHQDGDEVEYEDDPPRRGRRWMIAAALVCSIGVGGGLAYAYKALYAPRSTVAQTGVVKANREPAKVASDAPGGKRFPNSDNKFMNRLDGDGQGHQSGDTDANGVRRVQTVTVAPDRGTGAQAASAARPVPVPGMTIVGADSMPGAALPPAAMPGVAPPRAPAQPAPSAGGLPKLAVAAPSPPPPAPPPQAKPAPKVTPAAATTDTEPARQVVAKQPVPRAAAPSGAAVASAPAGVGAPKPRTGGYVAVLGYQRSQIEAMKMMADLQQKYDVLRDKRLEVVESDQSARGLGTIYRVVVGPSAGLDAAKGVCTQVVAAGHPAKDCYTLGN